MGALSTLLPWRMLEIQDMHYAITVQAVLTGRMSTVVRAVCTFHWAATIFTQALSFGMGKTSLETEG